MSRDVPKKKQRDGILGGGKGSFIGAVHRIAAELDDQAELIAGAMATDPQRARDSAAAWYLQRSYDSFAEMAAVEAQREDGIDFVIVATPNHVHYSVAKTFLEHGIHVVCDKPMTFDLEQAQDLVKTVEGGKLFFSHAQEST